MLFETTSTSRIGLWGYVCALRNSHVDGLCGHSPDYVTLTQLGCARPPPLRDSHVVGLWSSFTDYVTVTYSVVGYGLCPGKQARPSIIAAEEIREPTLFFSRFPLPVPISISASGISLAKEAKE